MLTVAQSIPEEKQPWLHATLECEMKHLSDIRRQTSALNTLHKGLSLSEL